VAGRDWSVSTQDPLAAIHVAVNRVTHGDPGWVGAVPDLVVLDRDPFDDPSTVGAARVVSTWVDGEVVHEA
jgi:predicted amidohydrolase YtcJ